MNSSIQFGRLILVLAKQTVLDVPIFGRASAIASAALDILGGRTHWRISQKRGNDDQIVLEVGSGKRQKAGRTPRELWLPGVSVQTSIYRMVPPSYKLVYKPH